MWQRSNTPSYDKNRAGQQCASAGMTALDAVLDDNPG
jgi:hypothetical protein